MELFVGVDARGGAGHAIGTYHAQGVSQEVAHVALDSIVHDRRHPAVELLLQLKYGVGRPVPSMTVSVLASVSDKFRTPWSRAVSCSAGVYRWSGRVSMQRDRRVCE